MHKKMTSFLSIVLCFMFFISNATATETMNGYKRSDFANFEKEWKFVTVRYRQDTKEMRFTYANPIAWQALLSHSQDYPDGAIFGKVSFVSKEDIDFPSSVVPSNSRRSQFMVRNKSKHQKTGGWGYALFDSMGKPYSGDHHQKSMACAACHQIVKDRGQVFSRIMGFTQGQLGGLSELKNERVSFQIKRRPALPSSLQKLLPHSVKEINVVVGPLTSQIFSGTLDEIRPLLIDKTLKSGRASALVSDNGKMFSLVFFKESKSCIKEKSLFAIHSLENKKLYKLPVCANWL